MRTVLSLRGTTRIVCTVLLLTGCGNGVQEGDCLILAGTVQPLTGANPAEALALRGDRIEAVGTRQEVEGACGPDARILDLSGGVVLPALPDHHVHLLNVGLSILNQLEDERLFLDLSGITSLEELSGRLRERAEETPAGDWILGKGWDQGAWGSRELPDRSVLDAALPGHPAFLTRTDGHAGWANALALAEAGIETSTPDPPGGAILRRTDGAPSGVLLERAVEPVVDHLPAVPDEDVVRAFRLAAGALAARGVTEAFDAGFLATPGVVALNLDLGRALELLVRTDLDDPLPIRIHVMVPAPSALAERVIAGPGDYRSLTPRVGVSHLKLFVDGALGSRGGALTHPYADDPDTQGVPRMSVAEILHWSRQAVNAGLGVAVHAIGDDAVGRTLDAFEALLQEQPDLDPHRLRIEHFSYVQEDDFPRALRLSPVLSIQSNFNSPLDAVPSFAAMRVGEANEERVYAWRRLHDAGAHLAEGSDYFALPGPPLLNFHAALTTRNGLGAVVSGPEGRLDALRLQVERFPPGGGGSTPGRLEPGSRADLVIFSADPLMIPLADLLEIEVRATFREGVLIHEDGSLPEARPMGTNSSGP